MLKGLLPAPFKKSMGSFDLQEVDPFARGGVNQKRWNGFEKGGVDLKAISSIEN